MSCEPMLGLEGVEKTFRIFPTAKDRLLQWILPGRKFHTRFEALRDISFTVGRGETVGIIGQNGSGKSTLLQIVCGTVVPSAGTVTTNGRIAALLELGAGFNPEFTGRENIYLNAAIYGLSRAQIDQRLAQIVDFAEIGDFLDRPVKTYSSGMYVRLAFAVIAHVDADILVIDEALAVGDALFTQKCMRFLRNFQKTGTILFVSHDSAAVTSLCERAIWLQNGKIAQIGDAKSVSEAYLASLLGAKGHKEVPADQKPQPLPSEQWVDQRKEMVNASTLRNDLEVFRFNPDTADFGHGGAKVVDAWLCDATTGQRLSWAIGGELCAIEIQIDITRNLDRPIVGFYVKDRLGQTLFGDNTYLTYADRPRAVKAGNGLRARFTFPMPWLPPGDYSIAIAVADGDQTEHVQHHWIHDAIVFRSHASAAATGLVGIPMLDITLDSTQRSA